MNSRNVEKNSSSKYLRSWNFRSKLYLVSCFYASLLMLGFEDLIVIFYIWVPNLAIEVIVKIINFKQHFSTIYRPLTKKNYSFCIPELLFGQLFYACTHIHLQPSISRRKIQKWTHAARILLGGISYVTLGLTISTSNIMKETWSYMFVKSIYNILVIPSPSPPLCRKHPLYICLPRLCPLHPPICLHFCSYLEFR